MLLSVFDRLILINILPKEGDFTSIKIVRKLREELSFSEDEHKALQFKQDGQAIKWLTEAEQDKDVEIGPKAHQIISDVLVKLDKDKKLMEQHVALYEKFVQE